MSFFESLRAMLHPEDVSTIRMPAELPVTGAPSVPIRLRPLTVDDENEWNNVRWNNADWLDPWESGDPLHGAPLTFEAWIRRQRRSERAGTGALFAITHQSRIVGQISLGAICYGSMRTGIVGYWMDRDHIGRGFAPMAVAVLADWALLNPFGPRLHRLEIAILPENQRSRRVVEKLHAHPEGLRPRYMYINGRWRDHETYSLLAEDGGDGFAARLLRESA